MIQSPSNSQKFSPERKSPRYNRSTQNLEVSRKNSPRKNIMQADSPEFDYNEPDLRGK